MSVHLRKGNMAWADRKRKEKNMAGAYETKQYRNVFAEYGYSEEEIEKRVQETFETIFHGSEEERFYHEAGEDMGFMEDTGNHDARTEGMSYGMMVCVQLDKKEEFDRLWKWTRTYMYMDEGSGKNYFAWSCALDGTRNADGPAPDGARSSATRMLGSVPCKVALSTPCRMSRTACAMSMTSALRACK